MPTDITPLDIAAFVWFLGVWVFYTVVQDHVLRGPFGVNQYLKTLREHWMRRMMERDNRIMDSQLIGHTIHSVTFFASTTMLVVAGIVGLFGTLDTAFQMTQELAFTVKTSRAFFELKLLLLLGLFFWAFFKFTWALRQYNYGCALIGAAPLAPVPESYARPIAANIAVTITLAITSFNGGLRTYYFALAALTWFIHPWLFIAATAWVVAVILRRQGWSRTYRTIRSQAGLLDDWEEKERAGGGAGRTGQGRTGQG